MRSELKCQFESLAQKGVKGTHMFILLGQKPVLEFFVQGGDFFDGTFFCCDSSYLALQSADVSGFRIVGIQKAFSLSLEHFCVKVVEGLYGWKASGRTPARSRKIHAN